MNATHPPTHPGSLTSIQLGPVEYHRKGLVEYHRVEYREEYHRVEYHRVIIKYMVYFTKNTYYSPPRGAGGATNMVSVEVLNM